MAAHIIPKTDLTKVDAPRPLTEDERQPLAMPKMINLEMAFSKRHPERTRTKKVVEFFDPYAERVVGEVDWSKQAQDTSQRRTSGKRKNESGKRS